MADRNQYQLRQKYMSIKTLSLQGLSAKQHLLMAVCRDVSLLPPLYYTVLSLRRMWQIMVSPNIKLYEPQSFRDVLTRFWQTYMLNNNLTAGIAQGHAAVTATIEKVAAVATTGNAPHDNSGGLIIESLVTARASEYLFCSLWCLVALYLSYAILDSLMVRWIVKYSTVAAILRMFSMSLIFVSFELLLLNSLSPENNYYLHTWILISCILTCGYIWQSYLTSDLNYIRRNGRRLDGSDDPEPETRTGSSSSSNDYSDRTVGLSMGMAGDIGSDTDQIDVDRSDSDNDDDIRTLSDTSGSGRVTRRSTPHAPRLRKKSKSQTKLDMASFSFSTKRTIDLYNITVFCVVPVGLASFITMVGLLRNLFIQRLDVEQLARILQDSVH